MTREELIDKFCEFKGKCTTDDVVALTYAYKSLQLDFINKASEWMDCYIDNYLFVDMEDAPGIRWDDFINDFSKAMKGGSNE